MNLEEIKKKGMQYLLKETSKPECKLEHDMLCKRLLYLYSIDLVESLINMRDNIFILEIRETFYRIF